MNGQASWYWAPARYKSVHVSKPQRKHLWERTVFLVRDETDDQAREIAERLAEEKQHEYLTADGKLLRWVLVDVEEVKSLIDQDLSQGTEVYWEFFYKVDKQPE